MPVPFAAGRITPHGGQGTQYDIPLLKGNVSASVYRLRCERLLAHSQIEAKLPIIGNIGNQLDTSKHRPAWAKIWVELMAGYKPTSFAHSECFIKPCYNIPDTKDGRIIRTPPWWSVVGYVAIEGGPVLLSGLRLGSLQ
jgi:hypothetical protein